MKLEVTASFRRDAVSHDPQVGASLENPGGGLARKAEQLQLALPALTFVPYLSQARHVHITEALWFTGGPNFSSDVMWNRIEEYKKLEAFKVLWTSDLECLRWTGNERDAVFEASDVVAANSNYMFDVLSAYVQPSKLCVLTDPIDPEFVRPEPKALSMYASSQVVLEKGIADIVRLFRGVEGKIERVFLGSPETWGLALKPQTSYRLDGELSVVSDRRIKEANREDVKRTAASSWLFASFARFESFGYAMAEALLAGCWVFCIDHRVYVDRPVFCFPDVESAVASLLEFIETRTLTSVNQEGRQFVIDNYSLSVFRSQFMSIVGRGLHGAI